MIEHDLEYPEKRRMECTYCRTGTMHFSKGREWLGKDSDQTLVLKFSCRICENVVYFPTWRLINGGELSYFIVRR